MAIGDRDGGLETLNFPGDWLLVKGGTTARPTFGRSVFVATRAQVDAAVSVFLERDEAGAAEPLIFLAPAIRTAFVEAATTALLDRKRASTINVPGAPPLPFASVWDVRIDLRAHDVWWQAITPEEWRKEENREANYRKQEDLIVSGLGQAADLTEPQQRALAQWVASEGLGILDEDRPNGMTVGGIITHAVRMDLEGRLHPAATGTTPGWTLVTQDPGRQSYVGMNGLALVPEAQHAKALRELSGHEIPVGVEHLVKWMTDQHDDDSPDCRAVPTLSNVQRYLEKKGIRYPRSEAPRVARSAARLLMDPGSLEPPPSVLPFLAWRGRLTVFAAREKQGKSTLVGSAVAAMTRGNSWLTQPTVPGNVLWLHEESERDVIARLVRFGADLERVFLLHLPLSNGEVDLKASVAAHAPTLIVIDSLTRFATSVTQDTSAAQWQRVLSPLLTLAHRTGTAILALHHAGKRDGEYRDSTEIGAAADMLIQMPGGLKGRQQQLEARGRIVGIEPFEITVELSGAHHLLRGQKERASTSDLTATERRALAALQELVPDTTAPATTIPAWERQARLTKSTFDRAREALVEGGHVRREGKPRTRGQRFRPSAIGGNGPTSSAQAHAGLALAGHS